MIEILKRYIATILYCLDIELTNSALFQLTSVVVDFIDQFFSSLLSITEQQRRFQPGYIDLLILFKEFKITPASLLYQLYLSKIIQQSETGKKILPSLQQSLEIQSRSIDSPPEVEDIIYEKTKQYDESSRLLPPTNKRKFYIQNYLPEFPPDHTYKNSIANERKMENPKKLRQILVHEGNQALLSLLQLQIKKDDDQNANDMEVDETKSLISPPLSDNDESNVAVQISKIQPNEGTTLKDNTITEADTNTPNLDTENNENVIEETIHVDQQISEKNETLNGNPQVIDVSPTQEDKENLFPKICSNLPTKHLDIVLYANSRLSMLKTNKQKEVDRINKLRSDLTYVNYLSIRKHLSSYKSYILDTSTMEIEDLSNKEKPSEVNFPINYQIGQMIKDLLSNEYELLLRNLKLEDKHRIRRLKRKIEMKKEKQKLVLEKQEKEMKAKKSEQESNAINVEIEDAELDEFENFDFDFNATITTATSNNSDSANGPNNLHEEGIQRNKHTEKPPETPDTIVLESINESFEKNISTGISKHEQNEKRKEVEKQENAIKSSDTDVIDIDIGDHPLDSDEDDEDLDALLEDV